MATEYLKEGEYVGHEVYFPNGDPPQAIIDNLISNGFIQSSDGFYIPRESLGLFQTLVHPYRVGIMQSDIILGGDITQIMNQLLDMINQLKAAGVKGIDTYIEKIKGYS